MEGSEVGVEIETGSPAAPTLAVVIGAELIPKAVDPPAIPFIRALNKTGGYGRKVVGGTGM